MFSFGREVGSIAQAALQFLILSFGGNIISADDAEGDDKKKNLITHFVMDRPLSDAFLNGN